MIWKIQVTKVALDCLMAICDGNLTAFARIKKAIDGLSEDPEQKGVRLVGPLSGMLKLRVGQYRIIYTLQNEIITVTVIYAGHRREVYTKLRRMLKK